MDTLVGVRNATDYYDIKEKDVKLLDEEDFKMVLKRNFWDTWKADKIIDQKVAESLVDWVWKLRKKHGVQPEIPARTYTYLCETNPAPRELYYHLSEPNSYSRQVTRENADRLFAISEKLCGITYPSWIKV